jgi:hypothetical protein
VPIQENWRSEGFARTLSHATVVVTLWILTLLIHILFTFVHAALLLVLAAVTFYSLYVIKTRMGIDIFPNWGLHLRGPRSLARWLRARSKKLGLAADR